MKNILDYKSLLELTSVVAGQNKFVPVNGNSQPPKTNNTTPKKPIDNYKDFVAKRVQKEVPNQKEEIKKNLQSQVQKNIQDLEQKKAELQKKMDDLKKYTEEVIMKPKSTSPEDQNKQKADQDRVNKLKKDLEDNMKKFQDLIEKIKTEKSKL